MTVEGKLTRVVTETKTVTEDVEWRLTEAAVQYRAVRKSDGAIVGHRALTLDVEDAEVTALCDARLPAG